MCELDIDGYVVKICVEPKLARMIPNLVDNKNACTLEFVSQLSRARFTARPAAALYLYYMCTQRLVNKYLKI